MSTKWTTQTGARDANRLSQVLDLVVGKTPIDDALIDAVRRSLLEMHAQHVRDNTIET